MPMLTPDEARFLIKFALQQIPPAVLQDMQRGSAENRAAALDRATDIVTAHFARARHEIHRPVHGGEKGPARPGYSG